MTIEKIHSKLRQTDSYFIIELECLLLSLLKFIGQNAKPNN